MKLANNETDRCFTEGLSAGLNDSSKYFVLIGLCVVSKLILGMNFAQYPLG
jgi:hypothetical protein